MILWLVYIHLLKYQDINYKKILSKEGDCLSNSAFLLRQPMNAASLLNCYEAAIAPLDVIVFYVLYSPVDPLITRPSIDHSNNSEGTRPTSNTTNISS